MRRPVFPPRSLLSSIAACPRTRLVGAGILVLTLAGSLGLRPPPGASKELPPDRPRYDAPAKVKPIAGMQSALFAKEPLVADPVAFCFDDAGRIYIAESARQELGIEDNRSSKWWLMDDLQSQTVADRLKMYEKWASKREGGMAYYSAYEDRIRRIEDADGDGKADRQRVFAGPFNEPLDGTGAGVIAREGEVWYTNIPNLWKLIDRDGDGVAEAKDKVFTGFGVRVALRGHDMHGLAWGPDGKLYWSIGDRGYHIELPDGRTLADPRSGAVFRCNPDGSGFEVFCRSLRNPQELAFDDFGNLFTGDNNSDGGDKARIVYCVEAGESGWSMDYQSLEGANLRGPWNQEEIWAMRADLAPDRVKDSSKVQPAWTIPPLSHVSSGPSGLVHYPGLGLPERYRGAFFLCDFLGGDAYSRVLAFKTEPFGAGFRVVDVHPFIENVLPTDVDFGYDGKIYVSDWGGGWYSKGYGEIYTVWDPEAIRDPRVAEVGELFRAGFRQRESAELRSLLGHADQRVRLRAQFAIAERGPDVADMLTREASGGSNRLARVHAMWALGMIAGDGAWPNAVRGLTARLDDVDAEVRAQAAKVIGEARFKGAERALIRLLTDESLRVRYFAAMALGRLGSAEAHAPIVAMLAENDGQDVFLRHAGVTALTWLERREETRKLAAEPQVELRLCAALAMRRWRDPAISRLLGDADDRVVAEAARAINDLPMVEEMPKLAELASRFVASQGESSTPKKEEFRRERWLKVPNAGETNLETSELFNSPPTDTESGTVFEGKANGGDQYIQRVSGVVTAPITGAYVFQITSDDGSVLYLGADETPHAKTKIAEVQGYAGRGEWDGQPNQSSAPVMLEAGKRYYVEARHAEGGGDDFVAVGWIRPDGVAERPIGGGVYPPLAAPIARRVINACVRSDSPASVVRLADLARSSAIPEAIRLEAIAALGEWASPGPRDRVNGAYRAVDASKRDVEAYKTVLKQKLPGLVQFGTPAVRSAARELATTAGVPLDGGANFDVVANEREAVAERVACLRQLCHDQDRRADEAIEIGLRSTEWELRAEARGQLIRRDQTRAADAVASGLSASEMRERQATIRSLIGVTIAEVEPTIGRLLDELAAGTLDEPLRLDVLNAAQASSNGDLRSRAERHLAELAKAGPLAKFQLALQGGDAKRGEELVHYHMSATCMKCHSVGGSGGDAAPKLDGVGTRLTRAQILQSLIEPNAVVAQGYGQASAMPPMGPILSSEEIRDVVEYLAGVR